MNYYAKHIGDYLKDTSHLSLLEHGVYNRLLDVYYTRECGIPDDQVARLVGARSEDEREALQVVLQEFFTLTDGVWRQVRCDAEIARFNGKSEKAKRSAFARWESRGEALKSNQRKQAHSRRIATLMRTQCERIAKAMLANHQ